MSPKHELTYLQKLVKALRESLADLGASAEDSQLESWSVLIHESMSAQGRNFHSVQHVFDISGGADSLQTIAALFHDTVYYQVDGGLSPKQTEILSDVIGIVDGGVTLGAVSAEADPLLALVVGLFGFTEGQVLSPFGGLNEFLSAVLAVRSLQGVLTRPVLAQLAVCIEATVPFRKSDEGGGPADKLHARFVAVNEAFELGLSPEVLVESVHRATGLANRDVGNFGTTDRAWFLDNTWKLLPESNIPLRQGALYTVGHYQLALKKMEGFFSFLDPAAVFGSFRGTPDAETLESMTHRARRNIELGRRYLRAKLLAMSVLAALGEKTGGDAPVALFMGDLPGPNHVTDRLEQFLPKPAKQAEVDDEVYELLAEGRKSESTFDLRNSPLAAYLYGLLGDGGLDAALEHVTHPMDDEHSTRLLAVLPAAARAAIADGCAQIALTRADKLKAMA